MVEDEGLGRWGWTGIVFQLTNNQIFMIDKVVERNIIEVLNYLSWQKEVADLQKQQDKK